MAIDRGPWNALVDDDGSNLVGTVWNKDKIKTVILDPTDAAIAAGATSPPESGVWTPIDASGAGLALGQVQPARYWKHDKFVTIMAFVQYPTTANTARAQLGGLPFANGSCAGGCYSVSAAIALQFLIVANGNTLYINSGTAGVLQNAALSGLAIAFTGTYLTA